MILSGENVTGLLAILGSILSVVSVLYGIAQALQKADTKYVATLQARVVEDSVRITALEHSLAAAGIEREKLTSDLRQVTELLMAAQRQLAETTRDVRGDIAQTTDVAREAAAEAAQAHLEITDLHEQISETLKQQQQRKEGEQ